jgi:MoaA/NifB/PqqE/SkfB family radical SAM enzyme
MENNLFRFEPYWNAWIFSLNKDLYKIEEEPFGNNVIKTIYKKHPVNGLSAPARVQIQVTNRCNFACPHCYVSSGLPLPNEMKDDELKSLLIRLRDFGVLQIEWSGGEVFSRKGFLDLVRFSQSLGFENNVLTNGYAIGKIKSLNLSEIWDLFTGIQISVDGIENNFNKWVGLSDAWIYVRKAIYDLYKLKPEDRSLSITTTISSSFDDFEKIAKLIQCKDIEWRLAKQVCNGRSEMESNSANTYTQDAYYVIQEIRKKYNISILHPYDKSEPEEGAMSAEWQVESGARWFMYIKSNGDVYPFPYLDGINFLNAGNVLNSNLMDIWVSDVFNKYRSVTKENTGCAGCTLICQMWARSFNLSKLSLDSTPPIHIGCIKDV